MWSKSQVERAGGWDGAPASPQITLPRRSPPITIRGLHFCTKTSPANNINIQGPHFCTKISPD